MTQEGKELLIRDLCARLPYGVEMLFDNKHKFILSQINPRQFAGKDGYGVIFDFGGKTYSVEDCKPYLRPMSSMTEEEKNELRNILWFGYPSDDNDRYSHRGIEVKHCLYDDEKHSTYDFDDFGVFENFLLKNHLDYRGLIPMGIALEAPEGMYNK